MFWSSQSPKVLRGLNFFSDFEAEMLGGPKRRKRLNLLGVLGDCAQIRKIEASQHFGTAGAAKH